MAVTLNIPSQVKTYANLAAFPASGSLKTIYIAEDTNKTYRWDGSTYVEISASAATGLTIGTTAIASGTIGRVLFEGTGNVLQQSSSLFWDGTNNRLGIGTNAPLGILHLKETAATTRMVMDGDAGQSKIITYRTNGLQRFGLYLNNIAESGGNAGSNFAIRAYNDAGSLLSTPLYIHRNSGNIGINTTTDGGFKLDVNGTGRFKGDFVDLDSSNNERFKITDNAVSGNAYTFLRRFDNTKDVFYVIFPSGTLTTSNVNWNFGIKGNTNNFSISSYDGGASATERFTIFNTGNVGIGTTTNAGFKLDVNGGTRIKGVGTAEIFSVQTSAGANALNIYSDKTIYIEGANNSGFTTNISLGGSSNLAKISFYGNNNIYVGQANASENIPSALIAMGSTTKGFLPPRMTNAQKLAIASPATGLVVYDTTLNKLCVRTASSWETITSL